VDVDGDDVILEVAPGVEVRYMRRAVMDVVSPGETVDEDEAPADEADDAYDADEESTDNDVQDVEEADHVPADAEDTEDTAYEQATGTKKD
jgi:preprotein translocase subunit YajC